MNEHKTVFYIEIKNEIILYTKKITETITGLSEDDIVLSSEATQTSLKYYANQAYMKLCHIEEAAMFGVLDMSADYEPIELIDLAERLKEKLKKIESISDDKFARNVRLCAGSVEYRVCENVGMPFILATSVQLMKEYQKLFFLIIENENTYLSKVFR